jgi:NAD(P)-dependent dehydrogenase (short-subunit alcohol dehydrogenase family)
LAVAAHCGRWPDIDRLIAESYEAFGRIDILVNNAGMGPATPSHDVTEDLFDSIVNLNFKGPFRLASQIAHRMAAGEGGSIINVSSTGGSMPLPGIVPYGASKAALNSMTLSMAHEYGPKVRVNTLSAGPFLTSIAEAWSPEARETARNALGRPGQPHEVVTSALYLASPASSYTTGTLLRVDGGAW